MVTIFIQYNLHWTRFFGMVIQLTLDLVLRGLVVLTGLADWSAGWTASAPSTLAPFALFPSTLTFLAFFLGRWDSPGTVGRPVSRLVTFEAFVVFA